MAGAKDKKADPYAFTPDFERAVVALSCTHARFFGRVGRHLDPEAMTTEAGKLAVEAAQDIARDTGQGPASALIVVQRLRRWVDEGKVRRDEVDAVDDMVADAEDAGLPSDEAVISEMVPMLKRRKQNDVVKLAMSDYAGRRDFGRVMKLLEEVETLGKGDAGVGVKVGGTGFDVIDALRHLEKCPTGIDDLDVELGGGLPRGQLGMFIGGAGAGKSMALSHVAAFASRIGLFVGYATLELPEAVVLARITANHTTIPIDRILAGDPEAREKLMDNLPDGVCIVKEFTPQVTTVADVRAWVDLCENSEERSMDVLVVDYADKMTANCKDRSTYKIMEHVYEDLRLFVHEGTRWGWTASQATRADKQQKKKLDLEHVSDSVNKVRVVDLAITLNLDDGEEMTYYVAKNRTGKGRMSVGPLPTDFASGSIAPTSASMNAMEFFASKAEQGLNTGTFLDEL